MRRVAGGSTAMGDRADRGLSGLVRSDHDQGTGVASRLDTVG